MDEQKLQAYVGLIERLLSCPDEQKAELLYQNQKLVDAGLVSVMQQYAVQLLQPQGHENAAQWLLAVAAQLAAQASKLQTATPSGVEAAKQFLWEALQLVQDSNSDPQQIYPVWAQQQVQFNDELLAVLPSAVAQLLEANSEQRTSVAILLIEFGTLRSQFPLGDRWLNLELSIAAYRGALTVITRSAMPVEWAITTMNLASDYQNRILGDRADNIEQAIALFQQALEIRMQRVNPPLWALIMMNLAIAYSTCIRGDRAENIELAIDAYQQALTVSTRTAMPEQWAMTMHNLARTYIDRIQGDRAENIERAVDACNQALTVRTRTAMPVEWAMTMENLAIAYMERRWGDRAENIERAIDACNQALTVRTQTVMPIDWAGTMYELAIAYTVRVKGDRAENMEKAIDAYRQVLTVRTQTAMPIDWALTMMELATTYKNSVPEIQGEKIKRYISSIELTDTGAYIEDYQEKRAGNIELAISHYRQALTVITQASMPIDWSTIMINLGNAYATRIRGDRAENIEEAISAYQKALMVRTQTAMPVDWALTMSNLASAYRDRILGDRAENIELAIAAYQNSLEVFEPNLFPHDCRRTARGLGNLYSEQQRWKEAVSIYQMALQASENLYQDASLLDGKAAELAETNDLPRQAAYALARYGDLRAAVLTLEQGRARGLSETLERDRSDLRQLQQTHVELFNQYQKITDQLRNLETQDRMRITSEDRHSLTPAEHRTLAINLRQQLNTLLEDIRQVPGYKSFLAQSDFEDIHQALRPGIPFIYLIPNSAGSLALILTQEGITPLWFDDLPETNLQKFLIIWLSAYEAWMAANQNFKADPSQENSQVYRQAEVNWFDAIAKLTGHLWESLMAPLIDYLKQQHIRQATLISTGNLSRLPLHAAWCDDPTTPTGKRYALDEVLFTYAPNARSLLYGQAIAKRTVKESILAIDNPLQDLPNSSREVEEAIALFPQHKVLKHEEATIGSVLNALPHCNILHLSCHGSANLREPLNSGLLMNDGLLTLRDLFDLQLGEQDGIRLAVLSACETGLVGVELVDEAIGLPTGLLQAGVAGVIASLWAVSDRSTMMLLVRLYDFWRKDKLEPSVALRRAQQWLRDSTDGEKEAYFPELFALNQGDRSYAHPFHWAAFSYTGV
jgi:CHAT domain-containing protein